MKVTRHSNGDGLMTSGVRAVFTRLGTASVLVTVAMVGCAPPEEALVLEGVQLDADDIGGVVTSAQGPEAGVWVVAETTDLPTRFIRIVATDDQGRYVVPGDADWTSWTACRV